MITFQPAVIANSRHWYSHQQLLTYAFTLQQNGSSKNPFWFLVCYWKWLPSLYSSDELKRTNMASLGDSEKLIQHLNEQLQEAQESANTEKLKCIQLKGIGIHWILKNVILLIQNGFIRICSRLINLMLSQGSWMKREKTVAIKQMNQQVKSNFWKVSPRCLPSGFMSVHGTRMFYFLSEILYVILWYEKDIYNNSPKLWKRYEICTPCNPFVAVTDLGLLCRIPFLSVRMRIILVRIILWLVGIQLLPVKMEWLKARIKTRYPEF